jgi:hypothetical protein
MITVRNKSAGPVSLGALKLAPGESGPVDENRPGVRMLVESGRLVVVEGDMGKADPTADLVALRAENTALRNERDALTSDVARLSAMVDALGNGQSKPAPAEATPEAPPADPPKPTKKGG